MKLQIFVILTTLAVVCMCRPSEIIDWETENGEHEQEGEPGKDVTGEYSWVDPDGNEHFVKYVADENGFRVLDSNAVPEPVEAVHSGGEGASA